MTLEEVHSHVEAIDLDTLQQLEISADASDELGKFRALDKVCEIYQKVRPVFEFLSNFWLIPKKWKALIVVFMQTMDTLCPHG